MISMKMRFLTWVAVSAAIGVAVVFTASGEGNVLLGFVAFFGSMLVMASAHRRGFMDAMHIHIADCTSRTKLLTQVSMENKDASASITMAEENILAALRLISEDFRALGESHSGEMDCWTNHVHSLMGMVYARVGVRSSLQFQVVREKSKQQESA